MYKVEYCKEDVLKDTTYDNAFYSSLNNENNKWSNYYAYLKDKYDLCYNVESVTIDVDDIKNMKYDCFSNGLLLELYLMCKNNQVFGKYNQIIIENNSKFNEELIFNIFKTDWLINEDLINQYDSDLKNRRNYFLAMIEASEDNQDIKIQFRNKLYEYFIKTYDNLNNDKSIVYEEKKVLKLEKNKNS